MNIWLITIGEPIFHPDNKLRLHRTGIIAKYISEQTAHKVTLWASAFNHFTKEHLYNEDTFVEVNQNLKMIAVYGKGYKRNISVDRIIDHKQIAQKFVQMAKKEPKPAIIVAAFPTLGLCEAAIAFGKSHNIPVLIDYRDMWPEVFVDIIPGPLKRIGNLFFKPLFNKTEKVFANASGILSITEEFLNLGLKKANRIRTLNDGVFPLAYLQNQFSQEEYDKAKLFWKKINLLEKEKTLRICFFGTLGYQFDFDTIIKTAEILESDGQKVEFVLCGTGDKLESMKVQSKNLSSVFFPGYMNAAQIRVLMENSDIGLCPYIPKEAFLNSIPGKAIEYMSAGLPLLSTLRDGVLGKLIDSSKIGYQYTSGSPTSLVEAIKIIINNKEILDKQRVDTYKVYEESFAAENVYKNYTIHLENVVNQYNV